MKRELRIVPTMLTLFAIGCVVGHCMGCSSPAREPALPAYCFDETLLGAAIAQCTNKSSTREASRACKRKLQTDCGYVESLSALAHAEQQ